MDHHKPPIPDQKSTPRPDGADRVLDAAGNRAREGLRTLEDLARMVLDDAGLSGRLKALRHAVSGEIGHAADPRRLLGARDTPGDVGTGISTPDEADRADLVSVASAAAKRSGEALRSIEEVLKATSGNAGVIERGRYELYDLERTLVLRLSRRAPQWGLCVLLTESLCALAWEDVVRRSIEGGADAIQLREKELGDRALLDRARRLVDLVRSSPRRVWVMINDRADIAALSGADGVHLGQTDLGVADARRIAGEGAIVGVSCASVEDARRAHADGADTVGVGPMFISTTKPKPGLAGPETLRAIIEDTDAGALPHLAISGITAENAPELREAGCRGVAVSGAVCASSDPGAACAAILDGLGRTRR